MITPDFLGPSLNPALCRRGRSPSPWASTSSSRSPRWSSTLRATLSRWLKMKTGEVGGRSCLWRRRGLSWAGCRRGVAALGWNPLPRSARPHPGCFGGEIRNWKFQNLQKPVGPVGSSPRSALCATRYRSGWGSPEGTRLLSSSLLSTSSSTTLTMTISKVEKCLEVSFPHSHSSWKSRPTCSSLPCLPSLCKNHV